MGHEWDSLTLPPRLALGPAAGTWGEAVPVSLSPTPPSADINECTSLPEPCRPGFSCINTVGSYTCQKNPLLCGRGYHSSQDGTKCVGKASASPSPGQPLPSWTPSPWEASVEETLGLRVPCAPSPGRCERV